MKVSLSRHRAGATLAFGVVLGLISTGILAPVAVGQVSPVTEPARIEKLASDAYVWGLAPEFVYRFVKYNNLATAPTNTFGGGGASAAWNNDATNAGDASVLYLNSMMDLSGRRGAAQTPAGVRDEHATGRLRRIGSKLGDRRHEGARAHRPAVEGQLLRGQSAR